MIFGTVNILFHEIKDPDPALTTGQKNDKHYKQYNYTVLMVVLEGFIVKPQMGLGTTGIT